MTDIRRKHSHLQLRGKRQNELEDELNNLQEELHGLNINTNKSNQIEVVRKSIAHVRTVQNQMVKENLRKYYQGQKYKPKDLRPKQTRAIRRKLTSKEEASSLNKTQRNNWAFPKRTFAIKD